MFTYGTQMLSEVKSDIAVKRGLIRGLEVSSLTSFRYKQASSAQLKGQLRPVLGSIAKK